MYQFGGGNGQANLPASSAECFAQAGNRDAALGHAGQAGDLMVNTAVKNNMLIHLVGHSDEILFLTQACNHL
jgi:hypothetical protein